MKIKGMNNLQAYWAYLVIANVWAVGAAVTARGTGLMLGMAMFWMLLAGLALMFNQGENK